MYGSGWKTVIIDVSRSSEFSGDDIDRYSKLLDLGDLYEFITVIIPALSANAAVSVYIQTDGAVDTVPVVMVTMDDTVTGHYAHATSSGAGDIVPIFRIGGARYLRIHCGANQSLDRTFKVNGFNRVTSGT